MKAIYNTNDLIKVLRDYQKNNVKTVIVEIDEENRVKVVPK